MLTESKPLGCEGSWTPGIIESIYFKSYRQQICSELVQFIIQAFNHDVGRLDESGSRVAFFQAQFTDRFCGHDRRDAG